jgi:hypothetical protein
VPSINSWITTFFPAAPNVPSPGSPRSRRRPAPCRDRSSRPSRVPDHPPYSAAPAQTGSEPGGGGRLGKHAAFGAGIPCRPMNSCANAFELSNCAACLSDPKPARRAPGTGPPRPSPADCPGPRRPTPTKLLGQAQQPRQILGPDRTTRDGLAIRSHPLTGDAGVAGRTPDPCRVRRLRQFPHQGVFAAARADHQDSHRPHSTGKPRPKATPQTTGAPRTGGQPEAELQSAGRCPCPRLDGPRVAPKTAWGFVVPRSQSAADTLLGTPYLRPLWAQRTTRQL